MLLSIILLPILFAMIEPRILVKSFYTVLPTKVEFFGVDFKCLRNSIISRVSIQNISNSLNFQFHYLITYL